MRRQAARIGRERIPERARSSGFALRFPGAGKNPLERKTMNDRFNLRPVFALGATALAAGLVLGGCQQRTSTVATPSGTSTTTTVEPTRATADTASRAGDAVGDAALTAKVKTALIADPDVKALQIDVDTKNGVVSLNGTADQRANAEKAVSIAKGIDGVKSVEDHLSVKSSG
jgi:hypothetical protein